MATPRRPEPGEPGVEMSASSLTNRASMFSSSPVILSLVSLKLKTTRPAITATTRLGMAFSLNLC